MPIVWPERPPVDFPSTCGLEATLGLSRWLLTWLGSVFRMDDSWVNGLLFYLFLGKENSFPKLVKSVGQKWSEN
jgi:hypothetical protein